MPSLTLASTALMGLVLLLVAVGVARLRHWRPSYRATLDRGSSAVAGASVRPETVWMLVFFAISIAFTAGAVAIVSGAPIGVQIPESFWGQVGLTLPPFLLLLTALIFGGIYATLRARGHGQAFATGAGIGILGTLFVFVVALRLVLAA